jgi:cytochrome P450
VFSSRVPPPEGSTLFTNSMNFTDDPRHAELRAMVQKQFTPRRVAALGGRVRQITDELVDELVAQGSGSDLVPAFSGALPAVVIAELLGVPPGDRARFRAWADDIVLISEPGGLALAQPAMEAMSEYFLGVIETKRVAPADDILTLLTVAHDEGRLEPAELVDFGLLLLTGGHETTTSLINNTVRCLAEYPDQDERVRSDPTLVPALLEEVLRYRSPVQFLTRVTTRDVEIGGTALPAGSITAYGIGSANRDLPDLPDPDRFVVRGAAANHVGFGYGLHSCIGNGLARLESRIALTTLLTRLPDLAVDLDSVVPISTADLHGAKHMTVTF